MLVLCSFVIYSPDSLSEDSRDRGLYFYQVERRLVHGNSLKPSRCLLQNAYNF